MVAVSCGASSSAARLTATLDGLLRTEVGDGHLEPQRLAYRGERPCRTQVADADVAVFGFADDDQAHRNLMPARLAQEAAQLVRLPPARRLAVGDDIDLLPAAGVALQRFEGQAQAGQPVGAAVGQRAPRG